MGILGRLAEGNEVLEAIDRIARGERVLSNEVINTLVGAIEGPGAPSLDSVSVPTVLTPREREILSWLSTGGTNRDIARQLFRSEEHTSELQSLMRISYAVFCLKKKTTQHKH